MTIEIQRPELEALLMERMKAGAFQSLEDVIMQALETAAPIPEPQPVTSRPRRHIWEILAENMKNVPPEDFEALPKDGLSQIDQYVYGVPKRTP
jgi:hypothetical protein